MPWHDLHCALLTPVEMKDKIEKARVCTGVKKGYVVVVEGRARTTDSRGVAGEEYAKS